MQTQEWTEQNKTILREECTVDLLLIFANIFFFERRRKIVSYTVFTNMAQFYSVRML